MVHHVSICSVISEDLLAGKQTVDDNSYGLLSILFRFPRNGKRLPSQDLSSEVPWVGMWTASRVLQEQRWKLIITLGSSAYLPLSSLLSVSKDSFEGRSITHENQTVGKWSSRSHRATFRE